MNVNSTVTTVEGSRDHLETAEDTSEQWQFLPEQYRLFLENVLLQASDKDELEEIAEQTRRGLELASEVISAKAKELRIQIDNTRFPKIDQKIKGENYETVLADAIERFRSHLDIPAGSIRVESITKNVFLGIPTKNKTALEYDLLVRDGISGLQYLLAEGVDVSAISLDDFNAFMTESYSNYAAIESKVSDTVADIHFESLTKTRAIVERQITEQFSSACESLFSEGELDDEVFTKAILLLNNFFQDIDLIQSVPKRSFVSVIPIFRRLVDSAQFRTPEQRKLLNSLLEKHEQVIFHVTGFEDMGYGEESYESFMQSVFGLNNEEVLKRKERGWNSVIEHINTVLLSREKPILTLTDLREMHTLFSKGIVPYYATGLRTDKHDEPHAITKQKREVKVVRSNGESIFEGTPSSELIPELEEFIIEINRVINLPRLLDPLANSLMGRMAHRYIRIHPHTEKNGNMAALVVEAAKVLRYRRKSENIFNQGFVKRLSKSIGPDLLGLLLAFR